MPNTGVTGQIILAESGLPIENVKVRAIDVDPLSKDDELGTAVTNDAGLFHIQYSPDKYRAWILDRNPDIEVQIIGAGERVLWETKLKEDVEDDPYSVGVIRIHENNFRVPEDASDADRLNDKFWLVTHTSLKPESGVPVRLTKRNQIDWLVDGAVMFPAITTAIENATQSVHFMNLFFNINKQVSRFTFPQGKSHKDIELQDQVIVSRLERILKKKAKDQGVAVNVLVWELVDFKDVLIKLFDKADTADEVRNYFEDTPVKTNSLKTTQLLHIKMVVVDGISAFVIGSTISQGYFADQEHLIRDARHRGGQLMHDVSLGVTGPAVGDIDDTFATIWNAEPTAATVTPAVRPAELPNGVSVQVLRTLPGEMFAKEPRDEANPFHIPFGETGILESYQRAIMKAEQYIYIEDQYFVSDEVCDAIMQRMSERQNLEVILLLNVMPDIGGYQKKQASLIKQMRASLGNQQHRLGVFTMWATDADRQPLEVAHIYMHSKLAIIDDKWASVGTANVDGASLNQRQWGLIAKGEARKALSKILEDLIDRPIEEKIALVAMAFLYTVIVRLVLAPIILLVGAAGLTFSLPTILGFIYTSIRKEVARETQHANPHRERQPPRHPELNVVLYDGIAGEDPSPDKKVEDLRQRLWAEHLGFGAPVTRPAEGWLTAWNRAAENLLGMIQAASENPTEPVQTTGAKVLTWVPDPTPEGYLRTRGVKTKNIKIRSEGVKLPFTPVDDLPE